MYFHYIDQNSEVEEIYQKVLTSDLPWIIDTENVVKRRADGSFITDIRNNPNRLFQLKEHNDVNAYVIDAYKVDKNLLGSLARLLWEKRVIGFNIGYDIAIVECNYEVFWVDVDDAMIMYKIARTPLTQHMRGLGMDDIMFALFGEKIDKTHQGFDWSTPIIKDEHVLYAGMDLVYTERIYNKLRKELVENQTAGTYEIERRDIAVTALCNVYGVRVDVDGFINLKEKTKNQIEVLRSDIIQELVDDVDLFNQKVKVELSSPDQVLQALKRKDKKFKKLESTGAEELEKFIDVNPTLIENLIEYASLETKYTAHILPYIDKTVNGHLYPNIMQVGALTGRKIAANPNIMAYPKEKEFRGLLIAEEGYSFLVADYNALEARIVAAIANCSKMIEVFTKKKYIFDHPEEKFSVQQKREADIHFVTACFLLGKDITTIDKSERNDIKTVNYLFQYGGSVPKLMETLNKFGRPIMKMQAEAWKSLWFRHYHEIDDWIRETYRIFGQDPYYRPKHVRNIIGRLTPLDPHKKWVGGEALNYQVQTVAADGMKLAESYVMNDLVMAEWGILYDRNARIVMQIHDELVLQVPDQYIKEGSKMLSRAMETAMETACKGKIPHEAEVNVSKKWEK